MRQNSIHIAYIYNNQHINFIFCQITNKSIFSLSFLEILVDDLQISPQQFTTPRICICPEILSYFPRNPRVIMSQPSYKILIPHLYPR